jgi:hypothetical protein
MLIDMPLFGANGGVDVVDAVHVVLSVDHLIVVRDEGTEASVELSDGDVSHRALAPRVPRRVLVEVDGGPVVEDHAPDAPGRDVLR